MWRERCPPIPFHSPLCSSCTPPHLHALHPLRTHAGRRADRAPPHPFPFASRPLCPGCSPFPLAYALPAVRTPSHFACMLGRHKGQGPPLHLGAPPPLHALLRTCRKRRKDRGACKGRATQGVSHARRPTCQGRTEQKGTVRKGWGHRMMGSATQAANGGGAKGTQAGRGATQVRGAACERSGGHNRAGGWHMNGRWHTPFLHPCAQ